MFRECEFMNSKKKSFFPKWIFIILFIVLFFHFFIDGDSSGKKDTTHKYSNDVFSLISSSENKVFDSEIRTFAKKNGIKIDIEYDDTLKITRRLNSLEKYDAVWLSNSIWMYMIDSSKVKLSDTKSTSINPIVFGIRKSKAEELGFTNKEVYTQDIVDAVRDGNLKFSMPNPVTTNSGASAYLGLLTNLAGNPEVLTSEMIQDNDLKVKLRDFFSGVERSAGDDSYLEELFVNGDYEAVFSYESSIININKKLSKKKKEILYAIYPIDGVSISDSPIGYIDQKNSSKKAQYDKFVKYLLGTDGQNLLARYGRRTWYGGVTNKADKKVFNLNWGIDTTKYISPLKYPATSVIKQALVLYQNSIRKPIHVVFCLDYSGSMYGERMADLENAMDYILSERAEQDLLQFSDEDVVDIIPFSTSYDEVWHSESSEEMVKLLQQVKEKSPGGGTALYPSVERALQLLKNENRDIYNTSIVVMTDGEGNIGNYSDLRKYYKKLNVDIPVYSIKFGASDESQLKQISSLTNGKVFDGTTSLIDAFMEVRGYN